MDEETSAGGAGNVMAGRSRRGVVLAGLVVRVLVAAGRFRSLGHATWGRAAVLEVDGGRRFLRLDELRTSTGPDLFVHLSATPADGPGDAFDDKFLSLDRYRSLVIWCRRFTYAFGVAELAPAR
jgi:Electron transfer DM13